jgi:hypothetical protein
MVLRLTLASAVLVVLAAGCGSTTAGPAPLTTPDPDQQTCETEGRAAVSTYSNTLTLAAALPTTAGAVAQWEYTRNGPNGPRPVVSRWSAFPSSQTVVFCYFDGDFANFAPSHPNGPLFAMAYERALVIATKGQSPWVDHIGPKATNPLTGP